MRSRHFDAACKLHPEDSKLHFELGVILARVGDHDGGDRRISAGALEHQPALKRSQALVSSGPQLRGQQVAPSWRSGTTRGHQAARARRQRQFPRPSLPLGRSAETLGNNEAAEEHYNEVAAIDYSYLDVAQRLKRLI